MRRLIALALIAIIVLAAVHIPLGALELVLQTVLQ